MPYQARALAVYAVAFKITTNEELARLVGMDTKGVADKTYNKWKRYLRDNGWVIIRQTMVGKVTIVEVDPALQETPVTFTDMSKRLPSKYVRNSYGAGTVENTTFVKTTDDVSVTSTMIVKTTDPEVTFTDVLSRAYKESPSEILVTKEETTTTVEQEAARGGGGNYLDCLNGSAVDLVQFIAKYAKVDADVAERMLTNNIKAFTSEAMLEAYSVTTAEMVSGLVSSPYKYLIGVAKAAKGKPSATRQTKRDAEGESRRERMRRFADEASEKMRKGRPL